MMTLSPLRQRFVDDFSMAPRDVMALIRAGQARAAYAEHECNGDPHAGNPDQPDDKNENARLWGIDVERKQRAFREIAERYGFTAEFGTGLYPCLKDAQGRYVEVPYDA